MKSIVASVLLCGAVLEAAPPPKKLLGIAERDAVLALVAAVDRAQLADTAPSAAAEFQFHVLKSGDRTGYVPFRVTVPAPADAYKSAVVYVRAVLRREGRRVAGERSALRDALLHGTMTAARPAETAFVGPGEMPVGGPASSSARRATAAPAEASTMLTLQQRAYEKQKAAEDEARKRQEQPRDPLLFPFEDYHVAALTAGKGERTIERALALAPGEYDVYVALIDRARLKDAAPAIVRQTVVVPDFWNDQLVLSTLMLTAGVRTLKTTLPPQDQIEHPFAFGHAEVLPVAAPVFTPNDALSVVYQICNYGAPDADLRAEYTFYHRDGGARRLFNRTGPQEFGDVELPPTDPFETQAFAMQTVPLAPFPPGEYELEITVRDRLTRGVASRSVTFTVSTTR